MAKLAKSKANSDESGSDRPQYDSEGALIEAADGLRELMSSIRSGGLHGDGEHASSIKEFARVATAIATVTGELRARQKQKASDLAAMKPERVLEWFRLQSEDVRLHLLREMTTVQGGGSVL